MGSVQPYMEEIMSTSIINDRIKAFRKILKDKNIYAYIIPTTDFHGSEYVNPYFHCRQFMSGFDGSAGTLLVTLDEALLWTDGRYFLQAESQLSGTEIKLMKMDQPQVPTLIDYLKENCHGPLAFDGRLVSAAQAKEYMDLFQIYTHEDLVDEVWKDRPKLCPTPIYPLPVTVTGENSSSKLARLQAKMEEIGADYHLITKLEEVAWLNNLRGNDVDYTPVFYGFQLITKEDSRLYLLNQTTKTEELCLPENTKVYPYWQIIEDLKGLKDGAILLDEDKVSYGLFSALPTTKKIINKHDPVEIIKTIKNPVEIQCTKNAHIKDGVAMVNFIYWLKANAGVLPINEISAADYLEYCRSREKGFKDLSFETICGYGSNGAIVHYSATKETNKELESISFLLVDSGAHYEDGTTDITRTLALGLLTPEQKSNYTAVLKGHIDLAMATFPAGTDGAKLDEIARKPVRDAGLDYNHGTGHGVGHILSVHEGPQRISPKGTGQEFVPGMITSNEPGCYIEGQYGIRLENEILCVETDNKGVLAFETITLCPFDKDAINFDQLTPDELDWLDQYHQRVYETLSPSLGPEERQWLKQQTLLWD